ncbi:YdcF family protein, partial [Candidatus Poribacteria bacterium]|nr:YdcF family protein [Candidatus Poribacteria bacterium]
FTGMEYKLPGLRTTWPQLAKQEALSMGIPEEVIIMEERPTSTYEDAIFVKDDMLSRGFRSAIIVSSPHHTRRARMIFKKVFKDQKDISLQITPFEGGDFQVKKWWTRENELIGVVNEYCKLFLYLFKYVI